MMEGIAGEREAGNGNATRRLLLRPVCGDDFVDVEIRGEVGVVFIDGGRDCDRRDQGRKEQGKKGGKKQERRERTKEGGSLLL